MTMTLELQKCMVQKGKTVAIAESCTGGFLSHLITKNAGSSAYFLGSFITYSNKLKQSILGVKESTLKEFGAVSEPVVFEMAKGIFQLTEADFAIAISGIAGPEGGCKEIPVGTVWVAMGERGKNSKAFCLHLQGDRNNIIQEAATYALSLLYEKIRD